MFFVFVQKILLVRKSILFGIQILTYVLSTDEDPLRMVGVKGIKIKIFRTLLTFTFVVVVVVV